MGMSEAEFQIMLARMTPGNVQQEAEKVVAKAKARMNKWETQFARDTLEPMRLAGEIIWWSFEWSKLRLAANTTYTPDFAVVSKAGVLSFYEVKGFWRDDARVKIKVAAEQSPFEFIAVMKDRKRGGWAYEHFCGPLLRETGLVK